MDYESWMKTLDSSKDSKLTIETMELLSAELESEKRIDYFDMKRLVGCLRRCFERTHGEKALISVIEGVCLVVQYSDHDIEQYMKEILPHVVVAFLDVKFEVMKASKKCLKTYLTKTRNMDQVLQTYMDHGLLSSIVGVANPAFSEGEIGVPADDDSRPGPGGEEERRRLYFRVGEEVCGDSSGKLLGFNCD